MPALYLIRHGQASFGAADYDCLSALGEEQSRLLGDWFRHCRLHLDAVAGGAMRRHRQTADGFLEGVGEALTRQECDDGFNEFDGEAIIAKLRPEFAEREAMSAFLKATDNPRRSFQTLFADATARWTGGRHDDEYAESWPVFRARCRAALDRLAAAAPDREIAVFTSGGPITAIMQTILGIPDDRIFDLNWTLVNTGITKLTHRGGRFALTYLNGQAHLERHGRPDLVTYR